MIAFIGMIGFVQQLRIQKMFASVLVDGRFTETSGNSSSSVYSLLSWTADTQSSPNRQTIAATKIAQLIHELSRSKLRYYVYDDSILERRHMIQKVKDAGKTLYQTHEVFFEIHTIEILQSHPLRVYDPALADLYVIPMAVGAVMYGANKLFPKLYKESVEYLLEHPIFKSTMGHRHILFGMPVPQYSCKMYKSLRSLGIHNYYPDLWNVTVVDDKDSRGLQIIREQNLALDHDYAKAFEDLWYPLARYSFSMGLYAEKTIPLLPASWEKFHNSSYHIFYHSRESGSLHNSTQYRHAPFRPEVWAALNDTTATATTSHRNSIGHDLERDEWLRRFTSSKFCLAIRGDTPHSHALSRAVKVGCIPVVVSDFWPLYSPTLRHFVALEDFSVVLDEKAFLEDPVRELQKLDQLSTDEIREKLEWLAFAQRIFFAEHPESLFVPAFLSQAMHASHVELGGPELVNQCKVWKPR